MTVLAAACVTSCDWFALDNAEQHNATISGKFIDEGTGELVPNEVYSSTTGVMKVVELGWDSEATQTWYVKNNGTYRNNLVWAGKYRMDTKDANYYPLTTEFELKKGDNVVDFTVKPYVRFGQPTFTYDAASKKIIATCEVQVTDPAQTPTLNEVRLCCYTDCHVGSSFNNCKNDANAVASNVQFDADGNPIMKVGKDGKMHQAVKMEEVKGGKKAMVFNLLKAKYAFCERYMPEILPEAKPKKPTAKDILGNW